VLLPVPNDAAITVAAGDSVFRRSGRTVHGAGWQYDGSSPAKPGSKVAQACDLVTLLAAAFPRRRSTSPPTRLTTAQRSRPCPAP
jgi:hypothetical protein